MNALGMQESPTIVPTAPANAQVQQSAQTQQQTAQTGADLLTTMTQQRLDKLYQAQDQLNKEIGTTIKAASTPVPVSGTSGIVPPKQYGMTPIPIDQRPTYSRSGANRQGVANMIRGAANVVGAYIANKKNNEQKLLAVDIERVLEANQGIQQAKQLQQQNPNDNNIKAQTDAVIKKNTDIINSLLADPKKRKQIGKAFDINFIDPTQNNKPEHAALKQAAQNYAQQLQSKLPTTMAPNQVAQQRLGQLSEMQKTISDQIKATSADKIMETEIRAEEEQAKLAEKQQEELDKRQHWQEQSNQKSQQFQQLISTRLQTASMALQGRLGAAKIAASSRLLAADKTIQGRIQYAERAGATDVQMARVITGAINAYNTSAKDLPTELNQWQYMYNKPDASPEDKQAAQQHINTVNAEIQYKDQQVDLLQKQLTVLTGNMTDNLNFGDTENGTNTNTGSSTATNSGSNKPAQPTKQSESKSTKSVFRSTITPTKQKQLQQQPDEDKSDQDYINEIKAALPNA